MLCEKDMRNFLRHRIEAAPSASQWCRDNGDIDPAYVSSILAGRLPVGGRVLKALGYRKDVHFVALQQSDDMQ